MGLLFLSCSITVVFDLGQVLAILLGYKWPLNAPMELLSVGLLASGRVTIAQISDLHLGVMLDEEFLDRVIARLNELEPDIVVSTGDLVDGQVDGLYEFARYFR